MTKVFFDAPLQSGLLTLIFLTLKTKHDASLGQSLAPHPLRSLKAPHPRGPAPRLKTSAVEYDPVINKTAFNT